MTQQHAAAITRMKRQDRDRDIAELSGQASAGRTSWLAADILVSAAIETLDHGPFRNALLSARHAEMQRVGAKP